MMKMLINYSKGLTSKLGYRFRDNFPYALADIDFGSYTERQRIEIAIPKDPTKQAVYLMLFDESKLYDDKIELKDSQLFRMTRTDQSFRGILEHPKIDQIIYELRGIYDKHAQKKVKKNITIPQRGGERWFSTTNPTYEGSITLGIYVIQQTDKFNLAEEFEKVLKKHSAISMMGKQGKEDLEHSINSFVVDIETFT